MPTGSSSMYPAGTVRCGYPAAFDGPAAPLPT